ncbi:DUF5801 repeats-in-toxin domain-containing protein [Bradyrhizobium sp. Ce-3]|uniref:DUF5801 repeats-in-toxin domain-containing protein n=1 Tax=Bradyrhizobium sp. Ce-3 TaxID=2913970 RepID=UPI001FC8EB60|nr:DUF5801 repeats-in-toxin domain-containing protein [Bradyrhizobium sp. Ce-3]
MLGIVQTVTGSGTIARARGIAIPIVAGNPLCQGDVIETTAGAWVAIRLTDGTVLDLPAGCRLELGDLVQHAGSILRPRLFARTRSIFRLIGRRLAGAGILTAETSVGTVRASGLGMLSFAALTLSLLDDARAAEPNVTFLDDDAINYKDLHHGVFELVTKEAIPRHIIVDDPGETIVLTKRGSSVGVSHVTNSPSHMEELREDQQEALANFEKGSGSKGSGMPGPEGSPLLIPIDFNPSGSPLPVQDPLGPVPVFHFAQVEVFKPPPAPPSLNLGAGPIEVDTSKFDDFTAASGTFAASSSGGTLTFGISGGTAGNVALGGLTYNVSSTGQFGTLYLNSATGHYTFVPNNAAINALKVDATQSFVITVSDGTLSASESFNIPIVGVDDASVISGANIGSVVGSVGVSGASPGLLVATGLLTDTDVDDPANTFTAVTVPTTSAGGHGTFTITTGGVWTYTLNNADGAVQALHVGQTLTDSFTVTTIGGTPEVVTVTINGPLIGAGTAPSLTLSETHLTATALDDNIAGSAPNAALTTTSADFSAAFITAHGSGATVSYALAISGGNGTASGLTDSHTGLSDVLVLNGNTIEGHVGATNGTLAFTIALDPATGRLTFTEYRPVVQPHGTSPDSGEGVTLASGVVSLIGIVTKDGEYQDLSVDLGGRLTFTDDGPSITAKAPAPSLTLSETHLTATALDDHIAGSAPDATLTTTSADFSTAFNSVQGADGATISYALTITGGNGTASGLTDSHTGLADVLVLNGNTIEGHVGTTGGTLAFTIAVDPATGRVTFTEYRAVTQPLGSDPDSGEGITPAAGIVNLVATITDRDGDFQSASLDLGKQLTITDDGPSISANGTAPCLTLSEAHLTATALDDHIAGSMPDAALTTTSADFSTAFTSVQGADGATIRYALTIAGGNGTASGLIDSHTGCADVLVLNGNTIEGHVGTTSGTLAFTIAVDPATGRVTFTECRAVSQHDGESATLCAGIVNLVATITDKDGDFQSACLDLGRQLTITDDQPCIAANGTAPSLTLSETHLTSTWLDDHTAGTMPDAALTTTSAEFATAFTSVQGADGATTCYALTITGGNCTASGLIDSHTGCADVLVLHGNTIEAHVGSAGGALAFTIAVDPATGCVTFTEYRAVTQPYGTNPDTGEGVTLNAGVVNLVATVTDRDGDHQSASLDLGTHLTITDDGPTICDFQPIVVAAQDHQVANGTFDVNFGADGEAAMCVAVHSGAVGDTGYDLTTTSLGHGITSVHVTGNSDDYTFYYLTHAVNGGVELDAYLADCAGTLTDPFFQLKIDPNGTFCFDLEHVEVQKDVTVTGVDFDAPACGKLSLTAPDGQLVVTGSDCFGHPVDVKASADGIAVGDSGQQMDPTEQLNLGFTGQQSQVSFALTQWHGYGSAGVIFKVLDGSADVHDFCINVPMPAGGSTGIVVQQTSDASLIDTCHFDSTTSTYTLYVDKAFDQVQVDYDHAASGHATFAVDNIAYTETAKIPDTGLLFDVTAVDRDGDSATSSLQVGIQCHAAWTDAFAFAASPDSATPASSAGAAPLTSATPAQSFNFSADVPSPQTPSASALPADDHGTAWFATAGPAIPAPQPDNVLNNMLDALGAHTSHDLIV